MSKNQDPVVYLQVNWKLGVVVFSSFNLDLLPGLGTEKLTVLFTSVLYLEDIFNCVTVSCYKTSNEVIVRFFSYNHKNVHVCLESVNIYSVFTYHSSFRICAAEGSTVFTYALCMLALS